MIKEYYRYHVSLSSRKSMINRVIHGDCLEELSQFKNESIDLVIADPPYWKVINQKWDYKWRTEEDYILWSKRWCAEIYRVLKKWKTFYLFWYFRTLVLLIPELLSMGFELKQQIIIDKSIKAVSGRATRNYKIFPNTTETILYLVKGSRPFVREFLLEQKKKIGLSSKEINEALWMKSNGGGMWSIYTGNNVCEQIPTKEVWIKLQKILNFDMPYDEVSTVFNPQMGITDVWRDIDFYEETRCHPTQKPLKLIDRLILASTNPWMLVLDPFLGGGSTAVSAKRLGRKFIWIEIDETYYSVSSYRIAGIAAGDGTDSFE